MMSLDSFNIVPTDNSLEAALWERINQKTKPLGALGLLENVALQLGLIQQTGTPSINRPTVIVFAGDHGISETGLVNPYPQAVTAQMVLNFIRGGAAINVFCREHQLALKVVDAGVNYDFPDEIASSPLFVAAKIRKGTRNYLQEAAMNEEECKAAIQKGATLVNALHKEGCNTIGLGEMGIGNSTAAALIMSVLTGVPLESCVGKGTGTDEGQWKIKLETAALALDLHKEAAVDGMGALRCFGGYEIAMMAGAMWQAAALRMIIVVDGFIGTSALLVAKSVYPAVQDYCFFGHESEEKGHQGMLAFLKGVPLLRLGLRLGEGTGAALAIPLIRSAAAFLSDMASFASAGVSQG